MKFGDLKNLENGETLILSFSRKLSENWGNLGKSENWGNVGKLGKSGKNGGLHETE